MNISDIALISTAINTVAITVLWFNSRANEKAAARLNELIHNLNNERKLECDDVRQGVRYCHDRISKLIDRTDERFHDLRHVVDIFSGINDHLDVKKDIDWYKAKIAALEDSIKDKNDAKKTKGGKA